MTRREDISYMTKALELACKGSGMTSPNPMVGAVVVNKGQIVAEGFHRQAGGEHAESIALRKAGERAKGGTLYVTLEPCAHSGRTTPCVDKILKSSVSRVVYAIKDPNPLVNGKGIRKLRAAGMTVSSGILRRECERLNESFMTFHRSGRPFVIVKSAQTLDGRVSTRTGESKWITGPPSLKFAHMLRAEVDAVVVGSGTVLADDPALTVRLVKGRNPKRIIISSNPARLRNSQLIRQGNDDTIVVSSKKGIAGSSRLFKDSKIQLWSVRKNRRNLLDLDEFLDLAASLGLQSLLIEGGPTLATSFVKQGLADKVILITAPIMIGEGVNSIGDLGITQLVQAIRFEQADFKPLGRDCLFIGYPEKAV